MCSEWMRAVGKVNKTSGCREKQEHTPPRQCDQRSDHGGGSSTPPLSSALLAFPSTEFCLPRASICPTSHPFLFFRFSSHPHRSLLFRLSRDRSVIQLATALGWNRVISMMRSAPLAAPSPSSPSSGWPLLASCSSLSSPFASADTHAASASERNAMPPCCRMPTRIECTVRNPRSSFPLAEFRGPTR